MREIVHVGQPDAGASRGSQTVGGVWVQLTITEQQTLENLESVIEHGLNTFVDVGEALLTIRDERLYRHEYPTFEEYCNKRWNISRRRANQLISATEVINNLGTVVPKLPLTERQARPLTSLDTEIQIKVWQEAVASAPDGNITARHVQQVVDEITKPHVANNSGNNEWYTPKEYIEAARLTMGGIDLDPASSEIANENVRAGCYYNAEQNGLNYFWRGKVWMNPPYSGDLVGKFTEKLCLHFSDGDIEQACVLVNNATETGWFQYMLEYCSDVCFLRGRVKYLNSFGEPTNTPLQGQAILYFGNRRFEFSSEFSKIGKILHND
jgi:phage N-6-adenine-methyltransferase